MATGAGLLADQLRFRETREDGRVQRFDRLSGQIDKQGVARIVVPLGTLDSGLALRDERMKDNFFETSRASPRPPWRAAWTWPASTTCGSASRGSKLDFTLDLHGQQRRLKADVLVTRQGEGLVRWRPWSRCC